MTHTPGPWRINYHRTIDGGVCVYYYGAKIAQVYPKGKTGRQIERDAEANARLIAAAPEMLEIVREALEIDKNTGVIEFPFALIARMDNIIAKVEGKDSKREE